MKQYFFNTILGILGFIIVIVPFTGKVHDGRKKWLKGFTGRGWIICITFLISIFVGYFKDLQTDQDVADKDRQQKIEKRNDESFAEKRTKESNANIVNTFTEALAKYNLKYDSSQKAVLKVVRDSAKKETKIYNENHPELSVSNIELIKDKEDTILFRISFVSKLATSYHSTIKIYCVIQDEVYPTILISNYEKEYFNDVIISPDNQLQIEKPIFGKNRYLKNPIFYFVFIGTYMDLDKKKFDFKAMYSFKYSNKTFGAIVEPTTSSLIAFIHKNNILY